LVAIFSDEASSRQPVIFEIGVTDPGPADSTGSSTGELHAQLQHQPCKADRRRQKEVGRQVIAMLCYHQ
jgi:hypothetical protein